MAPTQVARLKEDVDDKEAIQILQGVAKSGGQSTDSDEMIQSVSMMLDRDNEKIQHLASKALANLAFDKEAAQKMLEAPQLRRSLSNVMKQGKTDAKLEATRVLNNCLSQGPQAAETIALDEDAMNALKSLCSSSDATLRYKGIDTLSTMSTYPAGSKAIADAGLIDSAVLPILGEKKGFFANKEQFDVARFEAICVLANCDGLSRVDTLNSKDLKLFENVLKAGLDGKNWAGRSWTAWTVLLPLGRITQEKSLHKCFAEIKIVKLLVQCLIKCQTDPELMVACFCLNNLSADPECRTAMQKPKYDLLAQIKRCEASRKMAQPHARAVRKKVFESAPSVDPLAQAATEEVAAQGEKSDDSTSDDRTESEDQKDQEADRDANKDQA